MPGHDQLFKDLFEQFLPDFLSILVPGVRARMKNAPITFLKGESFSDQPRGKRKTVDLLARIESAGASPQLVLVHVEIEAEAKNLPAARMHRYFMQLRLKHPEPILPLALYLTGGKGGILKHEHLETVWGVDVCQFRFFALGLEKGGGRSIPRAPRAPGLGLNGADEAQKAQALAGQAGSSPANRTSAGE